MIENRTYAALDANGNTIKLFKYIDDAIEYASANYTFIVRVIETHKIPPNVIEIKNIWSNIEMLN